MATIVLPGGEERRLEGKTVRLGRDPANDLALLADPKISRSHAELRDHDGQWILVDLGSSNGTRVNDRRIEQHPLRDGDRIQLGRTTIIFTTDDDPNPTETDTRALAKVPDLSERERQILALVALGLTDRQIGQRLFISPSTVRSHLDRIGKKTGLDAGPSSHDWPSTSESSPEPLSPRLGPDSFEIGQPCPHVFRGFAPVGTHSGFARITPMPSRVGRGD